MTSDAADQHITKDRFNNMGANIRAGIRRQNEAIEKQAQLKGVHPDKIHMALLAQHKGDMLTWLHQNGIPAIDDNPATLATQIAGAIMQGAQQVKNSYDEYDRELTYENAFDEYMGSMMVEEMANPGSKYHWSNNPEAAVSNADGDGSGDDAAGAAISGLSNVAGDIPVIGAIAGPILKIGGQILSGIGKKKKRKAAAARAAEAARQAAIEQAALAQKKNAGKKKIIMMGGAALLVVVIIIALVMGKK